MNTRNFLEFKANSKTQTNKLIILLPLFITLLDLYKGWLNTPIVTEKCKDAITEGCNDEIT